jgi:hypothetical protein
MSRMIPFHWSSRLYPLLRFTVRGAEPPVLYHFMKDTFTFCCHVRRRVDIRCIKHPRVCHTLSRQSYERIVSLGVHQISDIAILVPVVFWKYNLVTYNDVTIYVIVWWWCTLKCVLDTPCVGKYSVLVLRPKSDFDYLPPALTTKSCFCKTWCLHDT